MICQLRDKGMEQNVKVYCRNVFLCGYYGKMDYKEETEESTEYSCPKCGIVNMRVYRPGVSAKIKHWKRELGIK